MEAAASKGQAGKAAGDEHQDRAEARIVQEGTLGVRARPQPLAGGSVPPELLGPVEEQVAGGV